MSYSQVNNNNYKSAYFGGGCFWCIEAVFEDLKGVKQVISGYTGGNEETANYKDVSAGNTQHVEVCKITYDSNIISFKVLLEVFFLAHDPTKKNRQGDDIGPQYQSIILYSNSQEKEKIENYINLLDGGGIYKNIKTKIIPYKEFYKAENYHQNYFKLNPGLPYCSLVINPKLKKLREKLKKYY